MRCRPSPELSANSAETDFFARRLADARLRAAVVGRQRAGDTDERRTGDTADGGDAEDTTGETASESTAVLTDEDRGPLTLATDALRGDLVSRLALDAVFGVVDGRPD